MARPDRAEEGCTKIDSKIANAIEEEDELTGETCEVDEYKIILLEQITLFKSFLSLPRKSCSAFHTFSCT